MATLPTLILLLAIIAALTTLAMLGLVDGHELAAWLERLGVAALSGVSGGLVGGLTVHRLHR